MCLMEYIVCNEITFQGIMKQNLNLSLFGKGVGQQGYFCIFYSLGSLFKNFQLHLLGNFLASQRSLVFSFVLSAKFHFNGIGFDATNCLMALEQAS